MKKIMVTIVVFLGMFTSVKAQDWMYSFEEAKKEALKNDKSMVLVFAGSDWCAPCIKLEKEIWNTDAFKIYAKEHFVMLKADFPRRKKNALSKEQTEANIELFEIYNKQGIFPFVVVLDPTGKVLGETSYKKTSVENYIENLNTFIR